jgi:hypothetical protein
MSASVFVRVAYRLRVIRIGQELADSVSTDCWAERPEMRHLRRSPESGECLFVAEPGPSEGKPLNFLAKVRKRPNIVPAPWIE